MIRPFHATTLAGKGPRNRPVEWWLLEKTRHCPVCYKRFKRRKDMLQHLFNPLIMGHGQKELGEKLPKEIILSLHQEAVKRLSPKTY